jgi:hypothetical protein
LCLALTLLTFRQRSPLQIIQIIPIISISITIISISITIISISISISIISISKPSGLECTMLGASEKLAQTLCRDGDIVITTLGQCLWSKLRKLQAQAGADRVPPIIAKRLDLLDHPPIIAKRQDLLDHPLIHLEGPDQYGGIGPPQTAGQIETDHHVDESTAEIRVGTMV